jgi:hypothetical protein
MRLSQQQYWILIAMFPSHECTPWYISARQACNHVIRSNKIIKQLYFIAVVTKGWGHISWSLGHYLSVHQETDHVLSSPWRDFGLPDLSRISPNHAIVGCGASCHAVLQQLAQHLSTPLESHRIRRTSLPLSLRFLQALQTADLGFTLISHVRTKLTYSWGSCVQNKTRCNIYSM